MLAALVLLAPLVLTARLDADAAPVRVELHRTGGAVRGDDRGFLRVIRAGGEWISPTYRAWGLHAGDLDGDGEDEVVLGIWSTTPRHAEPEPHRTVWVLDARGAALYERWRGSALGRPLRDLRVDASTPIATLFALETTPGGCALSAYRWNGFGFGGRARAPVPCAPFCDPIAPCVTTPVGPRRARLDGRALTLEPWP